MRPARDTLLHWLDQHGAATLETLSLSTALPWSRGRGLFTQLAIAKNTVLLEEPDLGCFSCSPEAEATIHEFSATARVAPQQQEAAAWLHGAAKGVLSPFILTTAVLMLEISLGDRSELWPWLSSLPKTHDCLLDWTSAERAALAGTEVEGQDSEYCSIWQRILQPLLRQRPDWWPASLCSPDAFLYAAGMVQSRSFHINKVNWALRQQSEQDDLYMLAGIDMVNHATDPQQCNAALDLIPHSASTNRGRTSKLPGTFVLRAERDVAAGEEICISYGELSDAQLLRIYGFVGPFDPEAANKQLSAGQSVTGVNRHNMVRMPAWPLQNAFAAMPGKDAADDGVDDPAAEARQVYEMRVRPLEQSLVLTAAQPLPPQLLSAALVMLMEDEQYEDLMGDSMSGSSLRTDHPTFPLDLSVQELVASLSDDRDLLWDMLDLLLGALVGFRKEKLKKAQAAAQITEGKPFRLAAARQVQLGELHVLEAAIKQLLELQSSTEVGEDDGSISASDSEEQSHD